jgi:hypothetical protein
VLGRRAAEMTLMTLAFIYPHKLTGEFLPLCFIRSFTEKLSNDLSLYKGTGSLDRF